jgi:predicted PhzF superfamily epimerase YddE/YHI9
LKLPLFQVDAFSNRLFRGNPAAVVLLEDWLPDDVLQAVAAENNLAETAFVIPLEDSCPLRWFTPAVEVDLCGHATLAAGYVLFAHRFPERERLVFETRSGKLFVSRAGELLRLDFPARPGEPIAVPGAVAEALGAKPRETFLARDLLVVFGDEREIRDMRPDFDRVAALEAMGVIVTAPGAEVDFVSRYFAPRVGIPEDPVTGSAHCTLVPYWANRLGKTRLTARQLSARGGELSCEIRGDRVGIAGNAVEYLRGEINVP